MFKIFLILLFFGLIIHGDNLTVGRNPTKFHCYLDSKEDVPLECRQDGNLDFSQGAVANISCRNNLEATCYLERFTWWFNSKCDVFKDPVNLINSSIFICSLDQFGSGKWTCQRIRPTFSLNTAMEKLLISIRGLAALIIYIVGLVGNILVLRVKLVPKDSAEVMHIFQISLALADLLFILVTIPLTSLLIYSGYWRFGEILCKLFHYCTMTSIYASVYTLALMSLDRFLAVTFPMMTRAHRTPGKAKILICVLWILVILSNINMVKYFGGPSCNKYCYVNKNEHTTFAVLFFSFSFFIPIILICTLYGIMIYKLLKGNSNSNIRSSMQANRSKKRISKMVITVTMVFGMSWLPIQSILLYEVCRNNDQSFGHFAQVISQLLAYGNSCINPILYAIMSKTYRESLRNIFQSGPFKCHGKPSAPQTTSENVMKKTEVIQITDSGEKENIQKSTSQPTETNL